MTPSERRTGRVKLSDRYSHSLRKLDGRLRKRANKALEDLVATPQKKSLNLEALKGVDGVYSIRVNDNFRILLQLLEDKEGKYFLALDVANHDIYSRM